MSKKNLKKIRIYENLEEKTLPELTKILKKCKISKTNIKGHGKKGNVLKKDIILAILDHQAIHSKKPSINLTVVSILKKSSKVKNVSEKDVVSSTKNTPKNKKDVNSLKLPEILKELHKYPKYKDMSDHAIKKQLAKKGSTKSGLASIKDLRLELLDLRATNRSPKKVYSPKKNKTPSPKKVYSPKKTKTPSPSPKKKNSKGKTSPKKKYPNYKKCGEKNMELKDFPLYEKCASNKICNSLTGNCVQDIERNTKGKHILKVEGKTFVGDDETIRRLKNIIGGDISQRVVSVVNSSNTEKLSPPKKKDLYKNLNKLAKTNAKKIKKVSPKKIKEVSPKKQKISPKKHKFPKKTKISSSEPSTFAGYLARL